MTKPEVSQPHRRSWHSRLLLVLAMGLAMVTGFQAPAMAATSGCGSVCDGKDPDTYFATVDGKVMRCNFIDVITPYSATNVELRYSPFCRTAWARQTDSFGWLSGVLVQSYNSNGTLRRTVDDTSTSGSWSAMVNDKGMTARACFYQYDTEWDYEAGNRRILYCTARY
ncbi:DUF2690 domain-containing protein [Micromonospora sp. NPDC050276]|uniref:DUF2690 domain-containing protein n=1 Tax=Micromonospora sp. NPDC050276 TaxID=3364278 RepID=UPI003790513B